MRCVNRPAMYMMNPEKKKSPKFVLPVIAALAFIGATIGAFTGIAVVFALGMVGLVVALAAATVSARKEKRAARESADKQDVH